MLSGVHALEKEEGKSEKGSCVTERTIVPSCTQHSLAHAVR